jgi:ABC-2 type transport system permease protein
VTGFVFSLTLRQLLSRRSTLLLLGLSGIPVLLAVVYRLSDPEFDPERWTVRVLYVGLVLTTVLPLTALLFGTSVLGDELEDGTAVYLLTKPVPRWQILVAKLAAAGLLTAVLLIASTVVSGAIAMEGGRTTAVVSGFAAGAAAGSLAYSAIFVLLSLVTNRALITGLVYVFLWEGVITEIFEGTRYLSVRHCSLGLASWLSGISDDVYDAFVRGETALVMLVLATVLGVVYAVRRLETVEVRETT